jgi:hypothetical protein
VIIYRQNFFEEAMEFFVWDYRQKVELTAPIQLSMTVNVCLLNCFLMSFEDYQKNETVKMEVKTVLSNLQVSFFANSNAGKHPQMI